jgi:MOSC domain-containing protein YiiM
MPGQLEAIYVTTKGGTPLAAQTKAILEAGRGIVGDRYYTGAGTFSIKLHGKPDVEVTLIEAEEIEAFNVRERLALGPADLRRNLLTRGIRLNDLVGKQFSVGAVVLAGIRLCEPCSYLAKVAAKQVVPGLDHRAGLRARVVSGGVIHAGDAIVTEP